MLPTRSAARAEFGGVQTPLISTKTIKSELFRYEGVVRICFLFQLSILKHTAEGKDAFGGCRYDAFELSSRCSSRLLAFHSSKIFFPASDS